MTYEFNVGDKVKIKGLSWETGEILSRRFAVMSLMHRKVTPSNYYNVAIDYGFCPSGSNSSIAELELPEGDLEGLVS
jgi:hypothetical protein